MYLYGKTAQHIALFDLLTEFPTYSDCFVLAHAGILPSMTANNSVTALAERNNEPQLVGMKTGRDLVFPDPDTAPSMRAFHDWKAKGYFPSVKIGQRVFVDPAQVRLALESRFTINAR